MYIYVYVYVYVYVCMCMCMYMYMYKCIHTYVYIHMLYTYILYCLWYQHGRYIVQSDESIITKKIEVVGWDEWYAGNLSYHLGGIERPKVYMDKFSDALANERKKNFILITKNQSANKVCLFLFKFSSPPIGGEAIFSKFGALLD